MASIILFKLGDLFKFLFEGKYASCRKIGWNQAKEGKKVQFRLNFNLPPFAFADLKTKKEINLNDLDSFECLGCANLEDYLKTYEKCRNGENLDRTYLEFENIEFNWNEFPWDDFFESWEINTED